MNSQNVDQSGYIRMLQSSFTSSSEPPFASQDSLNADGRTHPNLPDNIVDESYITYFVLAFNHQFNVNPTIKPLCFYDADHKLTQQL